MIPVELRERDQWVLWRYETVKGRETKVPYTVRGRKASSTNPQTWATYDAAVAARNGYDGVGYVLSPTDPYVGFDLDLCVGEDGEIHDAACDVVKALDSYCEFSPSGRGLRIIVRGEIHSDRRETADVPWVDAFPLDGRKAEFAIFSERRYLALTGDALPDFQTIRDRQPQIDSVVAEYLPPEPRRTRPDEPLRAGDPTPSGEDMKLAVALLAEGFSESEATMRILHRRKFDRKSQRLDYIPMTIRNAREWLQKEAESSDTLRLLDVAWMLTTNPPPVPWLNEPILALGCVTMFAGREGEGKSLLALGIAAALGFEGGLREIAGWMPMRTGCVLYIDAENGEREAHRRVHGLNVTRPENLIYAESDGFNLKRNLPELERLIEAHRPRAVILDSLRSLSPGLDENDSMRVEAVLRPIVRLTQSREIATLILHHASRGTGEYRGSTAIGSAVDLGFALRHYDDDPERETRRRFSCWKSRPAAMPTPRWLTITEGEGGRIRFARTEPFDPRASHPRDEVAEALKVEIRRGCQLSDPLRGVTSDNPGFTTSELARRIGRDPTDQTVRRALERLVEDGFLERGEDKRYRPTPRLFNDDEEQDR